MLDRRLEVEARLDSLGTVGGWLETAARDGGFPYEVAFGLDLAVHEAIENVVRHACADGAKHRIQIHIRSDEQRVEVAIVDDCLAFDPRSVPAPEVKQRLQDVVPGGRGVQLMRHFTDEMRYHREAGRNVLTLARRLAPRSEGA